MEERRGGKSVALAKNKFHVEKSSWRSKKYIKKNEKKNLSKKVFQKKKEKSFFKKQKLNFWNLKNI